MSNVVLVILLGVCSFLFGFLVGLIGSWNQCRSAAEYAVLLYRKQKAEDMIKALKEFEEDDDEQREAD